MKSEKCPIMMNRFLALDKHERIPFRVTVHLIFCPQCRTIVRRMTKAERIAAKALKVPVNMSDYAFEYTLKNPISMSKWIVSGIAMVVLLLLFGIITNWTGNETLMLVFYLMFACLVTVYCALFIGCNMDFFVKKIETMNLAF